MVGICGNVCAKLRLQYSGGTLPLQGRYMADMGKFKNNLIVILSNKKWNAETVSCLVVVKVA